MQGVICEKFWELKGIRMTKVKLKGHEKFIPRDGWLNKGILVLMNEKQKKFPSGIDAIDKLGVGSNMVKAIRHYMQAFGLIDKQGKLSEFGEQIGRNDAYFEDLFTLWILHSHIAQNKDKATSWYVFFNRISADEFTKDELFSPMMNELKSIDTDGSNIPEQSVKDDISVLLNMYSKETDIDDPEDKNKSPFAGLKLIKKEGDLYICQQPELRRFSEYVVLYELYLLLEQHKRESISIEFFAKHLSCIYNLSLVNVNTMLDRLENSGYIHINRTAGLDIIYPLEHLKSKDVVEKYYNGISR